MRTGNPSARAIDVSAVSDRAIANDETLNRAALDIRLHNRHDRRAAYSRLRRAERRSTRAERRQEIEARTAGRHA